MQEDHAELPANDQELSQETGRSEGTPSWDNESEESQEEELDIAADQDELSDTIQREETPEQKNTPEGESRRVLKFSDYFNKD